MVKFTAILCRFPTHMSIGKQKTAKIKRGTAVKVDFLLFLKLARRQRAAAAGVPLPRICIGWLRGRRYGARTEYYEWFWRPVTADNLVPLIAVKWTVTLPVIPDFCAFFYSYIQGRGGACVDSCTYLAKIFAVKLEKSWLFDMAIRKIKFF